MSNGLVDGDSREKRNKNGDGEKESDDEDSCRDELIGKLMLISGGWNRFEEVYLNDVLTNEANNV